MSDIPHLKTKVTSEAVRLQNTVASGNPSAIKGARTRFENANVAYWEAVHAAWEEIQKTGDIKKVSTKYGVDPADVAEVA